MKLLTKTQCKSLVEIGDALDNAVRAINHASIQSMADKMQSKFEGLSEQAQEGERGQAIESLADDLQALFDEIDNTFEALNTASSTIADMLAANETE